MSDSDQLPQAPREHAGPIIARPRQLSATESLVLPFNISGSACPGTVTHARHSKPRTSMRRLRFSDETGGNRAEPYRPGPANLSLPALPEGRARSEERR